MSIPSNPRHWPGTQGYITLQATNCIAHHATISRNCLQSMKGRVVVVSSPLGASRRPAFYSTPKTVLNRKPQSTHQRIHPKPGTLPPAGRFNWRSCRRWILQITIFPFCEWCLTLADCERSFLSLLRMRLCNRQDVLTGPNHDTCQLYSRESCTADTAVNTYA